MLRNTKYFIGVIALLVTAWIALLPGQFSGPAINRWTPTANMATARAAACSALLPDGRILVAGGNSPSGVTNTVELYNADGTFNYAPPMNEARARAGCATLSDGRVLVTGGSNRSAASLSTAEVFDPSASTWTEVPGGMAVARAGHTATLLPWGAVLIAGGEPTGTVELFLTNGKFQTAGTLATPRQDYAVVALPNYKVLIAGGTNATDGTTVLNSIEVFSATDNSITPAGTMLTARRKFGASLLLDGTVLITGGYDSGGNVLNTSEIFTPSTGESVAGPNLTTARAEHQAYALPNNGTVLLVGGTDGTSILSATDAYPFWAGTFHNGAPMNQARNGMAASLMRVGGVVVAGGRNSSGILAGSEAYGFATIAASKPEYYPGQTASMSGTGWVPGEQVQIHVTTLPINPNDVEFTAMATADANGNVQATGFQIDKSHLGMNFLMTATGSQSIAQSAFGDQDVTTTVINFITPSSPVNAGTQVHVESKVTDTSTSEPPIGGTADPIYLVVNGVIVVTQQEDSTTTDTGINDFYYTPPPGNNNVQVEFAGDPTNFYASASDVFSYTVNPIASTTVLTVPGGTPPFGTAETFTATVTGIGGQGVPAGTVTFTDASNSNAVLGGGPVTLSCVLPCLAGSYASSASISVNNIIPGSVHNIVATYNPAAGSPYQSSSNTQGYQTSRIVPTFTIQVPTPVIVGQPFSVTVTGQSVAGYAPTAQLQLIVDSSAFGSYLTPVNGTVVVSDVSFSGTVSQTLAINFQNSDPIFTGELNYEQTTVTVNQATPAISVVTSPPTSYSYGTPVTYVATITPPTGNTGITPGGSVTFTDGGTNVSGALGLGAGGVVNYTPPNPLAAGPHTVTATYTGDSNFAGGVATYSVTVNADTTSTTITPSASTVNLGVLETYTAQVSMTPNTGNPPGTVTFTDSVTGTLCSGVALSAANPAQATCPYTYSTVGASSTHNVTATFVSSSGNVSGSSSAAATVTVNKATVTLGSVSANPATNPILYGAQVQYQVGVTPASPSPAYSASIVQFYDNGTALGAPVSVAAGVATTPTLTPTVGTHSITAQFMGDTNYATSAVTGPLSFVVNKATPTFTVTGTPITATYGGTVPGPATFLVNAVGSGIAPTGTFTITQGATQIGGTYTLAGATSFAGSQLPTSLGAGSGLALTINYSGDANYAATAYSSTITVNKATPTVTSFASSSPTSSYTTPVTFTLTLASPTTGYPTGSVNFSDSVSGALGSGTLSNGVATLTTANLTPGVHTISWTYAGDSNFNAPATNPTVTQTVNGAPTTTVISAPGSSTINSTITINVTVTTTYTSQAVGTVQINDISAGSPASNVCSGGVITLTQNASNSTGSCTITYNGSSAALGASASGHIYQGVYTPTGVNAADWATSTSNSATVVVGKFAPTLTLNTPSTPVAYGGGVTFTATLTPNAPVPAYSGNMQFTDQSNGNAVVGVPGLVNASGAYTQTPALTGGTHVITATFLGDSNYNQVTQNFSAVVITPNTPAVSVANGPTFTATYGGTFNPGTITVATVLGGVAPTGTISIRSGSIAIAGPYTLVGGSVTPGPITLPTTLAPAVGAQSLTFVYTPAATDPNYLTNSAADSITVSQTTLTFTLTSSTNPSSFNSSVTFTMTLTSPTTGTPTGTVQFYDSNTGSAVALGSPVTVNVSGKAIYSTAALIPGSHPITATYSGDTNFLGLTGVGTLIQTVNASTTTATISASTSTPQIGQTVTYTVTVAAAAGSPAPQGSVVVNDVTGAATPICSISSAKLVAGTGSNANIATGSCPVTYNNSGTTTGPGTHSISAQYTSSNTADWASVGSNTITVTAGSTPTTTTGLASSATNSYTYGALTNLSVNVTATGVPFPVSPAYAGVVTFYDGTTPLCGGILQACPVPSSTSPGAATLSGVLLGGGTHTITAQFMGDSNYNGSTASAPLSLTIVVGRATPAINVAGGPAFSTNFGGTISTGAITVTGSNTTGAAVPTGGVSSVAGAGSTPVGNATLVSVATNPATYSFNGIAVPPSLGVGTFGFTFTYAGDANYLPVSSTGLTLQVGTTVSNVTVTMVATPPLSIGGSPVYGQPLTLTAVFQTTGGASLTSGATIGFYDGATQICPGVLINTTTNSATCNISTLGVASHSITVGALTGDAHYTIGTVTPATFNVGQASSAITVTDTPQNSSPGQSVTITSQVTVLSPGADTLGTAGQLVTFYNNGTPIAACSNLPINASGQLITPCSYVFATAGSYNITAVFSGDTNLKGSNNNFSPVAQTVGKPAPTVTVISSGSPSAYGAPVTYTATVVGANGVTPTGSVQFNDGSTILGTVTLVPGTAPTATASITITNPAQLANGTHAITATYNGDQNYSPATSAAWNQVVSGTSPVIGNVVVSPSTAVWGQPVTLSVTVSAPAGNNGIPTGTVTFIADNSTNITGSPVAIPSGSETATLTGVLLPVGVHQITAHYNGDANFSAGNTPGPSQLNIGKAATTTIITQVNPAAVTYGQAGIVLTATVTVNSPGAGTPSGTVTFYDGSTSGSSLGYGTVSGGTATLTIAANSPLANPVIGSHNIVAVYSGDGNFQTSTSASSQLTVGKAASTTTVISSTGPSPSQSVVGQTVTFTATVSGGSSVGTAPTGTVTFSSNGSPIGSATINVNGGVATAVLSVPSNGVTALPAGTNAISAAYSGDGNYAVSNSPLVNLALQQVVSKAPTSIVLTSSSDSSVVGQNVTLTAIVTVNPPGSGTPTGTVNFYDTVSNVPTSIGVAQLIPAAGQNAPNQFVATITLPQLPQGNLALTATYSGDNNYLTSTSATITQAVSKPAVTVTITNNINPSIYGQPVTFTATVAPLPPGTGTPTGAVTFFDGANQLAIVTLVGGQATYTGTLSVGTHAVAVSYPGDPNYQPFISPPIAEVVNKIPSSISLTTSAVTAVASQVLTFTAQISPVPPAGVAFPSGQVAFFDGSNQIGVGQLSSGVATFSTAGLGTGLHYIGAVYGGDGNWTGTTSAFVPQTITLAQTTTRLVSSADPSVWGQAVTFTIEVGVAYPGTVPANGQVQLFDNTVALGQPLNVANGTVQLNVSTLTPGTHNIIAQYIGNYSFATSNSAAVTQTVNLAPTVTTLAALPNDSTSNEQVTLTAVVTVPLPGAGTPTGTVQFIDTTGNNVLGTAPLTNVGGVLSATLSTTQLNQAGAPRLLTATYSGDADFASSTSTAEPQSVFGTEIAVVNAAGYTSTNFSPDGAAAIFVDNLVDTTLVANNLPLPTSLAGVKVTVTDSAGVQQLAQLYFVSPTQINFLMPTNTAFGLATITVTNANGATASGIVLVTHTAPGIFAANQNGQGVAQADLLDVAPGGGQTLSNTAIYSPASSSWVANPIVMNSTDSYYLELYGTGIRYATSGQVTATINGQSVPVLYAGAQAQYPGLDQVDLQIPASLKGSGTVNVVITVNGQAANTVTVTIQ